MTAQVKREKNTITLPDSIVNELGDTEYFTVLTTGDGLLLTPAKPKKKNGAAKIQFKAWMSDDFDEPLEEFKEYM
jgi:hypothetical protein